MLRRAISLLIARFRDAETGAVTVDWIVLTAAIMGLSLAIIGVLWESLTTNTGTLNNMIETREVTTTF